MIDWVELLELICEYKTARKIEDREVHRAEQTDIKDSDYYDALTYVKECESNIVDWVQENNVDEEMLDNNLTEANRELVRNILENN